jgi:hypothetical protein
MTYYPFKLEERGGISGSHGDGYEDVCLHGRKVIGDQVAAQEK